MRLKTAVVAVAAAGLVAAGCGSSSSSSSSSSQPGVTSNSITFGTTQPLTGPAAPGYSLIAPASEAYFKWVDAHGGVDGRKINLIIKDDAYNPAQTVPVTHQLVLESHVFGIFEALGTPTHTKVVGFLNAEKIPDMFVATGCPCWDNGTAQPYTFSSIVNYTIEGKILGQYIKQHFPGEKVGMLYQNDDFGGGGLAGIKDELPASQLVSAQPYEPTNPNIAPQIAALKSSGAKVLVEFTVPIFTAVAALDSYKLGWHPQLVVSNVGIDPITVAGLLKAVSKGAASGTGLIEGAITDGYLPSYADTSNPWVQFMKKVMAQYDSGAPFDFNTEYGIANAYTLVQALKAAGKNLTRQGLVNAVDNDGASWKGPGLVPFRFSKTDHGGWAGVQVGQIRNGNLVLFGQPLVTTPVAGSPITPYTGGQPTPAANGIPSN
jgi:ABC-type branched-subunit amino acid transport system substrate-binding protein